MFNCTVCVVYVYSILVWSDWGSDPRIEIGSLDGSEDSRRVLVNSRLNNPKGLTIDYATDTYVSCKSEIVIKQLAYQLKQF